MNFKYYVLPLLTAFLLSQASAEIITSGLTGEYSFENSDVTNSATGNIADGVLVGTPTFTATGRDGASTVLTVSKGNYVTISAGGDIASGRDDRTYSFWLNAKTIGGNDSSPFRSGRPSINGGDFSLEFRDTAGDLDFNGWSADGDIGRVIANTWTHIVAIFDSTTSERVFYLNGVEVSRLADGDVPINTVDRNGIHFGGPRLHVKNANNTDSGVYALDDVLIYDRVLSAAEITTIFEEPPITTADPARDADPAHKTRVFAGLGVVVGLVGIALIFRKRNSE